MDNDELNRIIEDCDRGRSVAHFKVKMIVLELLDLRKKVGKLEKEIGYRDQEIDAFAIQRDELQQRLEDLGEMV